MNDDTFQVFDAHVHVGRWKTLDFAGRTSHLEDVADVLTGAGCTGALVMPTDEADNQGLLDAVKAWKKRPCFLFAAWINPEVTGLEGFLSDHLADIRALKFHPSFQRRPITDITYRPFLDLAGREGLPAVVHCGRWREIAGYELALEAAAAHPDVPFILSHMGGDSPGLVTGAATAIRDGRMDNVYLGTESIREYWLVRRALEIVGPEKLVFGSDHNLNHPASFLAVVDALDLSDTDRKLVVGGNARRILASHD
ncbi:MAG: amidohydrolase family protein [Deltaproteobacteria bacterium]|nr:amidohydrolase family protein [Deltaproteobacteria bacterium]